MSKADVSKKATELESKLKGKTFLGGAEPSDEDKKAFAELLGADNNGLHAWVARMGGKTAAHSKANELEGQLKGKAFLGGNAPNADDVRAFRAMLGENNTALYRWTRNIASYTAEQRKQFPAAAKGKATTYSLSK
eukprot:PhM_4_TR4494/c0_g1_i1/m.61964